MTSAVAIANPNGSNYFFDISEEMYENMPENLVQKIKDYNDNYTDCLNTRSYSISDTLVEKYNSAVNISTPIIRFKTRMVQKQTDTGILQVR